MQSETESSRCNRKLKTEGTIQNCKFNWYPQNTDAVASDFAGRFA
ncbi:hypothetical protein [Methanolapillus millepedarum]